MHASYNHTVSLANHFIQLTSLSWAVMLKMGTPKSHVSGMERVYGPPVMTGALGLWTTEMTQVMDARWVGNVLS
jgi:hypothetical protein